ncbi:MAG TPA: hypothetical protein VK867_06530 [Candidatus Limnocylindrales bacterium]|nr:hypothetical protein [Candidatus Limnocylindrales bacterium]
MMVRAVLRTTLLAAVAPSLLAACDTTATPSPSPTGAAGIAVLPEVEGFSYRPAGTAASVFVDSATTTLEGVAEIEIVQAAVATREGEEVLTIAFRFPGASDTASVDYMARILDGLEDGLQAGSERTTDGDAFVIRTDEQTLIMAPWGRLAGGSELVFLFALGPHEATEEVANGILNPAE